MQEPAQEHWDISFDPRNETRLLARPLAPAAGHRLLHVANVRRPLSNLVHTVRSLALTTHSTHFCVCVCACAYRPRHDSRARQRCAEPFHLDPWASRSARLPVELWRLVSGFGFG